jgi:hypothetical protein
MERKAREGRKETVPTKYEMQYLERSIENYSLGMELDYNQYYCSCNLPQLLRARGEEGDSERAAILEQFVIAACERAIKRETDDDWTRATLLGTAFRTGDVKRACALAKDVKKEGPARWKLNSTLEDLADSIRQTADLKVQAKLQNVYDDFAHLIPNDPA